MKYLRTSVCGYKTVLLAEEQDTEGSTAELNSDGVKVIAAVVTTWHEIRGHTPPLPLCTLAMFQNWLYAILRW